ncbi:MAG TPA: DUF4159 domain-containing protein [Fimbriimonadaceae bacterium]|nr:DUF4159 domain-containing protein [Fimbriimonadaceae bacterium]
MAIDRLIEFNITGVQPFDDLPVDAELWREAHGQHESHIRLHSAGCHRQGIVYGLEVVIDDADPSRVIVAPGLAIDSEGRSLVLTKPAIFSIDQNGPWYIVAQYSAVDDPDSTVEVEGEVRAYRYFETCQISRVNTLPKSPYVELGRVERSPGEKPLSYAKNAYDPVKDEINYLYRVLSFPYCYADGVVAEYPLVPNDAKASWKPNRVGLAALIREGANRGFHLSFGGPVPGKQLPNVKPLLLYMAGSSGFKELEQEQIEGLSSYLDSGGFLVAEASAPGNDFCKSVEQLFKKLKAAPAKIELSHSLLTCHHYFTDFPPGSNDKGQVLIDDSRGILYSSRDYGKLWRGGEGAGLEGWNRMRAAQEFGLNIIRLAAQRGRKAELSRLLTLGD